MSAIVKRIVSVPVRAASGSGHGVSRSWGRSTAFPHTPQRQIATQAAVATDQPLFIYDANSSSQAESWVSCVRVRDRMHLPASVDPNLPKFVAVCGPEFPARYVCNSADEDWDLEDWGNAVKSSMDDHLLTHGAMLFRGLPIENHDELSIFARYLKLPLKEPAAPGDDTFCRNMQGRSMQSKSVSDTVRTASDEPPAYTIEPHNEYHTAAFPKRLLLYCVKGPEVGGEWICSDGRAILQSLRPDVVKKFEEHGATYRVFYESKDTSNRYTNWQTNIAPTKPEVEAYLTKKGYEWKWGEDDSLAYWATFPAVVPHAKTGERTWFNQIHAHHKTFYTTHPFFDGKPVPEDRWPVHCTYGNGTEIEPEVLSHIRKTVWEHSVTIKPSPGDLLVCDNYLSLHGRMSFPADIEREVYVIAAYD